MPIFFFEFEARPKVEHPKASLCGGAFINCWVVRDTLHQAEAVARVLVDDSGWVEASANLKGTHRCLCFRIESVVERDMELRLHDLYQRIRSA